MKRKWKWLILLCLPVLCFAAWLTTVGGRQIPVDVIGDLSEKDVTEIVAAAKRGLRHEIFPDISWQTFKDMPTAIRRYSSVKLITVDGGDGDSAVVHFWQKTNGVTRFSSKTNYYDIQNMRERRLPTACIEYLEHAATSTYTLNMIRRSNGWERWVFYE